MQLMDVEFQSKIGLQELNTQGNRLSISKYMINGINRELLDTIIIIAHLMIINIQKESTKMVPTSSILISTLSEDNHSIKVFLQSQATVRVLAPQPHSVESIKAQYLLKNRSSSDNNDNHHHNPYIIQFLKIKKMKREGNFIKDNFIKKKIPVEKNDYLKQVEISKLVRQALKSQKIKLFTRLKYKNTIYTVGDTLNIFNDKGEFEPYVAKLIRVIKLEDEIEKLPFIQVEWFYKKNDLAKMIPNLNYNCISISEVFATQHKDFLHIESIMKPCKILNQQQYQKLEEIPPNIYFTRADYDYKKKELNPDFEKWKKSCVCCLPLNPDLEYIQCDICQRWYHLTCLNVSIQTARNLSSYICSICE